MYAVIEFYNVSKLIFFAQIKCLTNGVLNIGWVLNWWHVLWVDAMKTIINKNALRNKVNLHMQFEYQVSFVEQSNDIK